MSLFDLKQNADELPSLNQGIAKLTYQQVQTTRDATGNAFPKGNINLKWETSGVKWWIPSRSYIRIRCSYFKSDGVAQPVSLDDLAPTMGLASSLFTSSEFRMGDKTVSRVSDYMVQVDALQKRLKKSKSWMDGVGDSLEKWNPNFVQRQNEICNDGFLADEKVDYEVKDDLTATQFGIGILTTMAITGASNLATFAAAGVNLISGPGKMNVGDRIITDNGGNYSGETYEIVEILSSTQATVKALDLNPLATVAADVVTNFTFRPKINRSSQRSQIELIWQPPLSIWSIDHALPSGKYELVLTPQNSNEYQKRAVESINANLSAPTDFQFVVDDLYLYLATVEGPAVDSLSYFMSLEETRCQSVVVNNVDGLQQQNFDVSPATYAITCAFQNNNLQDTQNSPSKFKFPAPANSGGAPNLPVVPSGELNVERFFIQYNGEQKPSPDANPDYSTPKAWIASRYAESLLYSNAYFDQGGGESLQDWIDRGMYMYYAFPKDGSSESTRVNVNFKFRQSPGSNLANLLVFDHHKKMVLVSIQNGRIVDIIEQDG